MIDVPKQFFESYPNTVVIRGNVLVKGRDVEFVHKLLFHHARLDAQSSHLPIELRHQALFHRRPSSIHQGTQRRRREVEDDTTHTVSFQPSCRPHIQETWSSPAVVVFDWSSRTGESKFNVSYCRFHDWDEPFFFIGWNRYEPQFRKVVSFELVNAVWKSLPETTHAIPKLGEKRQLWLHPRIFIAKNVKKILGKENTFFFENPITNRKYSFDRVDLNSPVCESK